MKALLIAPIVAAIVLAGPRQSSAQQPSGFITAGVGSAENDERYPVVGGGLVFDFAKSWVSVGGQVTSSNRAATSADAAAPSHRLISFAMGYFGFLPLAGLRGEWTPARCSAPGSNCGPAVELVSERPCRTIPCRKRASIATHTDSVNPTAMRSRMGEDPTPHTGLRCNSVSLGAESPVGKQRA